MNIDKLKQIDKVTEVYAVVFGMETNCWKIDTLKFPFTSKLLFGIGINEVSFVSGKDCEGIIYDS